MRLAQTARAWRFRQDPFHLPVRLYLGIFIGRSTVKNQRRSCPTAVISLISLNASSFFSRLPLQLNSLLGGLYLNEFGTFAMGTAGPGARGLAIASSFWERVDHRQVREAGEIPVSGPEYTHPVKQAQCGHPGIVHECALKQCWPGDPLERIQVAFTFS